MATVGKGAVKAVMQYDGNFVVYNSMGVSLWSTKTSGNPGARMGFSTNGAFTIIHHNNFVLWSSI
jgi:hypothetical protein